MLSLVANPSGRHPFGRRAFRSSARTSALTPAITVAAAALNLVVGATLPPDEARAAQPASQAAVQTAARAATAATLYSSKVLLIDNHRVEATSNLYRNYVPGAKVRVGTRPLGQVDISPVRQYLGEDDAADGDTDIDSLYVMGVNSVIVEYRDGRPLYRMWLRSGTNVGYRESVDGLHWTVRDPDSVIVATNVSGGTVSRDASSGLYYLNGWSPVQKRYVEMVSKDGLSWSRASNFSGLLAQQPGDVISTNYDPVIGKMVAIAKGSASGGGSCGRSPAVYTGGRSFGVHAAGRERGPDGVLRKGAWFSQPHRFTSDCIDVLSVPRTPGTIRPAQHYGSSFQRYGDQVIGFPWIFRITTAAPSPTESGDADGPVDTQIASTPDVTRVGWKRADQRVRVGGRMRRPNLIERGPAGSWDGGMIFGVANMVARGDHNLLFYNGWNTGHKRQKGQTLKVGAVRFRLDRFVGMKVADPRRVGILRTKAFRLPSNAGARNLYVNTALGARSNLRVAVIDERTSLPVPGFDTADSTITRGDQLDAKVTWRGGNIGRLRSRALRLRISWSDGSVYAFQVR